MPGVPIIALSGWAFSQLMKPLRSVAGIVAFARMSAGLLESRPIGAKSSSKSSCSW